MTRSAAQAKPSKKSRIIFSTAKTTLSHASNEQWLAHIRAVVLRTTTNTSGRRLGQQSTHMEMEIDSEDSEDSDDEASELGDNLLYDTDPRQENIAFDDSDSDSEDGGKGPKRPPVCASFSFI